MSASTMTALCRVCLSVDVRLLTIEGSLQRVYEKLTDNLLHTADGKPVAACYICYAQLNKCRKLMLTAARAENVLNAILYSDSKITLKSVSLMDRQANGLCGSLTCFGPECFDTRLPMPIQVKTEFETDIPSTEIRNTELEGFPQPADGEPCVSDGDGPRRLEQPRDAEMDVKHEADMEGGFLQPIRVTVSGIHIKDEDSASDGDDNIPLESLHTETRIPGELEDGACAQISGAEKQKQAEGNVTDRNQQPRRRHSRKQAGERRHKCSYCQRKFTFQSQLTNHLRTHTGEKPYKCSECQRCFSQKGILKTHLKTHTGEKPFECSECQCQFTQKGNLKKHLRSHTGEKPYECSSNKMYECSECQRGFRLRGSLISHLRTHTREKPYECNECSVRLSDKKSLKSHLRIHTGEKPYECNECQRRFNEKGTLKSHLRTHTGEKPYECSKCQRRFSERGTLKTHIRTHTGEKPYVCSECQCRFNEKCTLKAHIRTHTGEKPYECSECHRRFSQNSSLYYHLKTHSDKKSYECSECPRQFNYKNRLKSHLITHNNKKT